MIASEITAGLSFKSDTRTYETITPVEEKPDTWYVQLVQGQNAPGESSIRELSAIRIIELIENGGAINPRERTRAAGAKSAKGTDHPSQKNAASDLYPLQRSGFNVTRPSA